VHETENKKIDNKVSDIQVTLFIRGLGQTLNGSRGILFKSEVVQLHLFLCHWLDFAGNNTQSLDLGLKSALTQAVSA